MMVIPTYVSPILDVAQKFPIYLGMHILYRILKMHLLLYTAVLLYYMHKTINYVSATGNPLILIVDLADKFLSSASLNKTNFFM